MAFFSKVNVEDVFLITGGCTKKKGQKMPLMKQKDD